LIVFITLSAVSAADENMTNPVEDIRVSYGDTYGDVLPRSDNTYDLYISNLPDECEPEEFNLYIDNNSVKYDVIEYERDFNQIYGQYHYDYTQSNHTLKLEFVGNDHYKTNTKTFDFKVTPAIIYIPSTVTQGISYDRSVEVYLAENVEGNMKIIADGKEFISRHIDGSLNRFPLDELGFGVHDVEAVFSNSIKAKKKVEVTYYLKIDFYADELIKITTPWDVAETPLIYIDGEKYAYNPDGITYTKIGTHTVRVTYPGDGKYPAKTVNATITIKGDPKIVAQKSKINMYYGDSKKAKFIVYGLDKVTVNVGTYSNIINVKNNTATFKIPALKPGKYTISAEGDLLYASTSLVVKHVVALSKAKIRKSAKKLTLTATLKSGKTPLKSKQVTFKFKGKKYTAKTSKKGIAKVTIPKYVLKKLKVGSKVTYKACYGRDIVKKTVKVQK
jgi:hypothetical protein